MIALNTSNQTRFKLIPMFSSQRNYQVSQRCQMKPLELRNFRLPISGRFNIVKANSDGNWCLWLS